MEFDLGGRSPINLAARAKEPLDNAMEQVPSLARFVDRCEGSRTKLRSVFERPRERIVNELLDTAE
jgi:hypothetical protein